MQVKSRSSRFSPIKLQSNSVSLQTFSLAPWHPSGASFGRKGTEPNFSISVGSGPGLVMLLVQICSYRETCIYHSNLWKVNANEYKRAQYSASILDSHASLSPSTTGPSSPGLSAPALSADPPDWKL